MNSLSKWKRVAFALLATAFIPIFVIAAILPGRRKRYVWGSTSIIANKYWSAAIKELGLDSVTIMNGHFAIQDDQDFDRYFTGFAPAFLPRAPRAALGSCLALVYLLRRGRVLHTSFWGFSLGLSPYWRLERWLLNVAGVKVIVIPFGMDVSLSSQLIDTSIRYAILATYPSMALNEEQTARRVRYWSRHADILLPMYAIDGVGRWDVTLPQAYAIDTDAWQEKVEYSTNNGADGPVHVLHNPNHRGAKGTEFVLEAVRRLCSEGLQVELVLAEKIPNTRIRELMQATDIHADQFIYSAYATSAIEAMSTGLPVLANLSHEAYTRVFRRWSFLDECPILSTTPETLTDNLRLLVTRPELRRVLGRAGRKYVEKYHSYEAAQFLFGSIYAKMLDRRDVDLINLFHPLLSEYNRRRPPVDHPLIDSRLPSNWNGCDDQEAL